ncbi:MerR family DNA-binding transcriptional regulator [Spiractinospora alimapuensis]|uniref:MerR family DNA-binding transcriptional regulator n=1 Tax=Spiractinospora alimapuensis TaxID=2820884 RepID=UPI001F1CFAE0|nr:MerR family DNA-binding transcriptional regulator [Spiractinospora alimapuensis]
MDLARRAGISTQQVRNYVALGLLPAVERTPTGYRLFTAHHAEAITLVRTMLEGHGWTRTPGIMRAVHAGDVATALSLLDQSHAALHEERREIAEVLSALDVLVVDPELGPVHSGRPARIGEVAAVTGVRTSALRLWEYHGLLRPVRTPQNRYRMFDAREQRLARVVALLRRADYPLPIVRAIVAELRATGNPERVRAELAKREQELDTRSRSRLRASAALSHYLEGHNPAVDAHGEGRTHVVVPAPGCPTREDDQEE